MHLEIKNGVRSILFGAHLPLATPSERVQCTLSHTGLASSEKCQLGSFLSGTGRSCVTAKSTDTPDPSIWRPRNLVRKYTTAQLRPRAAKSIPRNLLQDSIVQSSDGCVLDNVCNDRRALARHRDVACHIIMCSLTGVMNIY